MEESCTRGKVAVAQAAQSNSWEQSKRQAAKAQLKIHTLHEADVLVHAADIEPAHLSERSRCARALSTWQPHDFHKFFGLAGRQEGCRRGSQEEPGKWTLPSRGEEGP